MECIYKKPINLDSAQAVLTTSSNAIKIFSDLSQNRTIPLYTVGSTSKKIAEELGYKNIIDCQGDSVKMLNVVLNKSCKNNGDLIYIGADKISLDLPKKLREVGYDVKRYIVYKTREVDVIDKTFLDLIKFKKIKWIVLLSKKGATSFNKLVLKNIEINQLNQIRFACLSEKIANELSNKIKNKFFPKQPTLSKLTSIITQNE